MPERKPAPVAVFNHELVILIICVVKRLDQCNPGPGQGVLQVLELICVKIGVIARAIQLAIRHDFLFDSMNEDNLDLITVQTDMRLFTLQVEDNPKTQFVLIERGCPLHIRCWENTA